METLGLILGFLAGLFFAYPILWGYPKSNQRVYVENKLDTHHKFLKNQEATIDATPVSQVEKDRDKAAFRKRWDPEESALKAELTRLGPGHERLSFLLSLVGLFLLSAGFLFQLLGLLGRNVAVVATPGRLELSLLTDSLPPFGDASAAEPSTAVATRICEIRTSFAAAGVTTAIVVGRYDHRWLTPEAQRRYRTNIGLAQARADTVAALLGDPARCPAPPVRFALPIIGGNRLSIATRGLEKSRGSEVLAADRAVIIHGLRLDSAR